jgi:hypothetical protein
MTRSPAIYFTLTSILALVFVVVFLCGPFSPPSVDAQAQRQLVPLVTDQTPLGLPSVFGVAGGGVVNQAGDYAFFGNGASGIFYRRAGAAAAVRVMQMGDEVPGFPGSRADIIQTLRLNNSALLAFRVDFFQSNGLGQGIIFTFDGTTLRRIVAGTDPAPGGGGANFERQINLLGLNDSGDVSFTAPLVPSGSILPQQTTLYIVPNGGAPVRLAGPGDTAPGTSGGTYGGALAFMGFTNLGEELFRSVISGGSGGQGFFVGSASGVRKVAATGDTRPEGGSFPATFQTGFINNSGQVAFQAGSLYTDTPGTGTVRSVPGGSAVPAPVGGTLGATGTLSAFDDAGEMAFTAAVAGTPVSTLGLFRFRPGNPLDVVAYRNQAAPGVPGETYTNFLGLSMNSSGAISFQANLTGGSALNGVFKQNVGAAAVNIVTDGQATTLGGGGAYSVVNALTQTLNDGSVYFHSDVVGGTADYEEAMISGGVTTVLMNTADALPAGSRVSLRSFRVGAAGDLVGFLAQRTGGPSSIAVHNIFTQATSVIASDGDLAPGAGGGRLRLVSRSTVFLSTGATSVTFAAQIIGGSAPGTTALFVAAFGGGLTRIAGNGDVVPGTSGKTLSGISLNGIIPAPVSESGVVVFFANLVTPGTGVTIRALCVWTPGIGLSKVAAIGDVTSTGGAISSLSGSPSINLLGQVAFSATTGTLPGTLGLFIGAGGTPAKVVAVGDAAPSGGTFATFAPSGFNNAGKLAFISTLTGGSGGGVFIGSSSSAPAAIALNGAAAPSGGNFSITTARPDVSINNADDMVFRASLTGGTADSGYFIRRGPVGPLQTAVLQGQAAPGTTGVFDTIVQGVNNLPSEQFQLGPDGDLAFQSAFLAGGQRTFASWHLKPDNTLEEILVRGTVAPEFGGGFAVVNTQAIAWNSGARYPIWARVSGGTFTDAIFLFVPTINTNTPPGTVVPVTVTDSTTGTAPVNLTFDNVTQAGETTLTTSSGGPAIPTAFALGDPPVFYNVETTATFAGSINICVDFSSVSFPPGGNLRLLHFDGTSWVDVTTSGPSGNLICGSVTSLSPFTVVQVLNQPPSANAGADQVVECTSHSGCSFTLNGSGSTDPDHDTLGYVWKDQVGNVVGTNASVTLTRPLGTYTFTLTVTDPFNQSSTATTHVTVRDTTPPTLTVALSPNSIWPPDNKMAQITATIQVTDLCDPNPQVRLISTTSNEALGSGDIRATLNADTRSFQLRATRAGSGSGRVYTITYRATDASGNSTTGSATVFVPHDQRN